MHKSDYLAQVEALRASPELRARVAGLAVVCGNSAWLKAKSSL